LKLKIGFKVVLLPPKGLRTNVLRSISELIQTKEHGSGK
jgi:hypothetical protein